MSDARRNANAAAEWPEGNEVEDGSPQVPGDRHLLDGAIGAPAVAERLHAEVEGGRRHADRGQSHRRGAPPSVAPVAARTAAETTDRQE